MINVVFRVACRNTTKWVCLFFLFFLFERCHNCDLQRNGEHTTYGCALTDRPEHRVCHSASCTARDMRV